MPEGPLGILGRPLATEECTLVYTMVVPIGDEGQVIENLNPFYPDADINIFPEGFQGEEVKRIELDTGEHRLNVQNDILQFQPKAEIDVKYLWPKDTRLTVRYDIEAPAEKVRMLKGSGRMYWSFELSESISSEEYNEFAEDPDNKAWANMTDFKLNNNGDAIFMPIKPEIQIRDTKRGLLRSRDFAYDALLGGSTPSIPLREGRNSDIITCIKP